MAASPPKPRFGPVLRRGLVLSSLLAVGLAGCGDENQYVEPPPPEVTVTHPSQRDVVEYLEATGTANAVAIVDVRARVRGILEECHVDEGSWVDEGQLLLVIDDEPYRVQLEEARAELAEAEIALKKARQSQAREVMTAQLELDESQLNLAITEEERLQQLIATRAVSQEELDRAVANRKKNEAQVIATRANLIQIEADFETNISSAQATVAVARAALRRAEIDVGYCRISAPTAGRIGRIHYDVGNLVGNGEATLLTTVVQYNPIHVYTTLSAEEFLKFRSVAGDSASLEDGKPMPVELALAGESGYRHRGHIDYHDPIVDKGTGTIQVRGLFPNEGGEILPGMFARIRIPIAERADALLVPEQALGLDQAGQYLLVVGEDDKVDYRPVQAGRVERGMRVVEGQISRNDRVVVEGLLRARPGMKVVPLLEPSAEETAAAPSGTHMSTATVSRPERTRTAN